MGIVLLKPAEVDLLLRYPIGRALKLAKAKCLPHIVLPDGEIRFDEAEIEALLTQHHQGKESTLCSA